MEEEPEIHENISSRENEEDERHLFLKKSSKKRLYRPRRSLAAFSELSLSRSSFRLEAEDERVRVEYYVNENTIKERLTQYFYKNQRSSLRIRIARFILKLITCILYIIRVVKNPDPTFATCYSCNISDKTKYLESLNKTEEEFRENPTINWDAILWVTRPLHVWIIHLILAIFSFIETLLLIYLGYKGNIFRQLLTGKFILEMLASFPFIITLCYPPFRNLFVPVFLNCWIAKYTLENLFNDLHRAMQRSQSALSQQLTILSATLVCLVFTSVCGIQHFQRAGHRRLDLFQSTYFVVVTFSTVGYGDFVPDIWPSQLFMVAMICIAIIILPTQFEQLAFTWMERQKLGGSYSSHRAQHERHVVVCCTTLHADTIMDFLNEFYAHPLLQAFYVVLLSPMELDPTMRMILQVPMWAQRVIYLQGSCLKDSDLTRARMGDAEACFILAARNYQDKSAADEHTILRSWALKDFAPHVPQYVQIFRPENKIHVRFAEHVVCEDEFKYALLANNCLFPGASTLVTLLLHTSRGQEGQLSKENWQQMYGKCSGNEIYHIRLNDSRIFGEYDGKSFTYASFHAHRKYGVCLVGVRPIQLPEFYEETILLNPGPKHIMKKSDLCFYLSITKEEQTSFVTGSNNSENPSPSTSSNPDADCKRKSSREHDRIKKASVRSSKSEFRKRDTREDIYSGNPSCDENSPNIHIEIDHIDERRCSTSINISMDSQNFDTTHFLALPSTDDQRSSARRPSILPVPETGESEVVETTDGSLLNENAINSSDENEDDVPWIDQTEKIPHLIKGFPPVSPYIGVSPTLCYLLKRKKPLCCLQLAQTCEHCANKIAYDYNWQNGTIILAADYASSAIYNFIVPLRAHFRPKGKLNPIILLLGRRPDVAFLDAISYFPYIYWFLGSIDCLDDLLRAGITLAESVVVVNKELSNSAEEDTLSDCNTIVAVQTMFRFFPHIRIVTELSQSSNMRFMQFRARDTYALNLSRLEKREKERGSHISYMFRLPFAAGSVFSASMLDTLLYQAFVKDYLITFVRLLLGIDQAPGSGFLTSTTITKDDLWIRTYGRLYQKLCSSTCEIPIGIYRTQESQDEENEKNKALSEDDHSYASLNTLNRSINSNGSQRRRNLYSKCFQSACGSEERSLTSPVLTITEEELETHAAQIERAEISNLVQSRMIGLGLPTNECDRKISEKRNSLSYVIINPSCDLALKEGDIVYLIRPSPFAAQKTFERHNSRRRTHMGFKFAHSTTSALKSDGKSGDVIVPSYRRDSTSSTFPQKPPTEIDSPVGSCISKSNSTSLPDSPKHRTNVFRLAPKDDILLRRSNSLRFGLGMAYTSRRTSHDETMTSSFNQKKNDISKKNFQPSKPYFSENLNLEVTSAEEIPIPSSSPGVHGTIV